MNHGRVHSDFTCPSCSTRCSPRSIRAGQIFVDGTLGAGGHTRALAETSRCPRDWCWRWIAIRRLGGRRAEPGRFADQDRPGQLLRTGRSAEGSRTSRRSTGSCSTWGCRATSWPTRSAVSASTPPASSICDSITDEGEPAWQLIERLTATELANLIFQLRRGTPQPPNCPGDRRAASGRADSHGQAVGRNRAGQRPAIARYAGGSIRRRVRFRPCASR